MCGAPDPETEAAHWPSGESVSAVPSANRMGADPSTLRMATAPSGPAGSEPTEPSSNNTDPPSGEISLAMLQSYQERSRTCWSFPLHSIARRSLSSEARIRPSGAMSCRVKPPGMVSTRRCLPARFTAHMVRLLAPLSKAVNHTSLPCGDHAKPLSQSQPEESVVLCPARSTMQTEPLESQRWG